jgi:putative nucleotidyltransferase with HDIG domain
MNPESLIDKVEDLSVPAPSVVKLLSLLNLEDIDNAAVVEVVRTDAVLSAKLLALANSAYFASPTPIESCDEALFYLGYEQVHRIAIAVGLAGLLNRHAAGYAMDEGEFWRHSLLTAKAAELLANAVPHLANPSIAYTAGLLHDIGKLVLNQFLAPEPQARLEHVIEERGHAGIAAEKSILGADHAEVGALLLKKWNVPREIYEAVKEHHVRPQGGPPRLSTLVALADSISHSAASTPGNIPPENGSALLKGLGIDQAKYEEILGQTAEALAQIETLSDVARA